MAATAARPLRASGAPGFRVPLGSGARGGCGTGSSGLGARGRADGLEGGRLLAPPPSAPRMEGRGDNTRPRGGSAHAWLWAERGRERGVRGGWGLERWETKKERERGGREREQGARRQGGKEGGRGREMTVVSADTCSDARKSLCAWHFSCAAGFPGAGQPRTGCAGPPERFRGARHAVRAPHRCQVRCLSKP